MLDQRPDWLELPHAEFESRFRPAHNATRAYLHRVLLRALDPVVRKCPSDAEIREKPLDVALALPLPPHLRFYIYGATQHASERQTGTFKVQLTSGVQVDGSDKLQFDRTAGVRPVLVGYQMDHAVFILWDADLHDLGGGFPFSKNVQAPPEVIWGALARGLHTGSRRLKKTGITETLVAARPLYLPEALELRIQMSNETLCNGMPSA